VLYRLADIYDTYTYVYKLVKLHTTKRCGTKIYTLFSQLNWLRNYHWADAEVAQWRRYVAHPSAYGAHACRSEIEEKSDHSKSTKLIVSLAGTKPMHTDWKQKKSARSKLTEGAFFST
jgi:hypothetical protein